MAVAKKEEISTVPEIIDEMMFCIFGAGVFRKNKWILMRKYTLFVTHTHAYLFVYGFVKLSTVLLVITFSRYYQVFSARNLTL